MTDAKGQGKSVEELFPCPFFTGAETGQCKSNGSLYAARHLWEEAAKRLKGQIKGQTEKKKSETLRFQTSQWQREKDSNPHIRSQSPLCYHYTIPLCSLDEHLLLYQRFCICQELIANFPDFFHFGRFYNEIGQSGRHPRGCSVRTDFVQRYMRRKRGSI